MTAYPAQMAAAQIVLGDERRVFDFEADFAHDLRCIPMVVRFKLDRCGIKLSLKQWSRFGCENRAALLGRRCDTPSEIDNYRQTLTDLVESRDDGPVVRLDSDPPPVWTDERRAPVQLIEQAARSGIAPPSNDCWARLAPIERFALVKLARSNHENENFESAMREFGLLS